MAERYRQSYGTLLVNSYVVGPSKFTMSWTGQVDPSVTLYWCTLRIFDAVDLTGSPDKTAVVPGGMGSVVSMEASSDLKTWQSVIAQTNAPVATNQFFRVRVDLAQ